MSSYGELANTIIQQKGAGSRFSGLNTALDLAQAYKDARLKYQMESQLKQQEGVNTGIAHIYGSAAMTGMPVDPSQITDFRNAMSGNIATGQPQTSPSMTSQPNVAVSNTPGTNNGITVVGSPSDGRNNDAIAKYNPNFQARIKAIADYKQPIGSLRQLNAIGGIVSSYDPSFDANQYKERQSFIQSTWDKGELSKQRAAIENVTQHATSFQQYMEALNNGNIPLANSLKNKVAVETGNPAPQNAATFARVVGIEAAKAISPTGVLTDEQQRETAKSFPENASPAQAAASVQNALKIMQPRMNNVLERYKERMGKYPDNAFSPEAINALKSLSPDVFNSLAPKLKVNGQPVIPTPDNVSSTDNGQGNQTNKDPLGLR